MKSFVSITFALSIALSFSSAAISMDMHIISLDSEVAHGGGCRKSSPRGQCCHMQTSVGVVHCH